MDTWFEKQSSQQLKRTTFYHSCDADHKLQHIHAGIAYFRQGYDTIAFKYAFIAFDIVSRVIVGCPMKGKPADDCKQALECVIDKFGNFEELYSDSEGGLLSTQVVRLLNKHSIKHIATYGNTFHAEKATHIIKMGIHNRLQGLTLDKDEWPRLLNKVIHTYNYEFVSTAHNLTPYDATKYSNTVQVWLSIYRKSRRNNMYDKIQVGDHVRVMLKKNSCTKAQEPNFSTETYKVIHVGKYGGYLINHPQHRRVWWIHELRFIEAAADQYTEYYFLNVYIR